MPPHCSPEGELQVPWGEQAAPPLTTDRPDKGGQNIRGPTQGRPEASITGREGKRVDLGVHVETRGQEILCAPISRKGSSPHSEVELRNCGKLEV